jgi:hypothetical protein
MVSRPSIDHSDQRRHSPCGAYWRCRWRLPPDRHSDDQRDGGDGAESGSSAAMNWSLVSGKNAAVEEAEPGPLKALATPRSGKPRSAA